MKNILKKFYPFSKIYKQVNDQYFRDDFILTQLSKINSNESILDAGCGNQRYKEICNHLQYFSQDFKGYKVDKKIMLGTQGVGGENGYTYGENIDYIGNIWDIDAPDQSFDNILCTEVLEHIPYAEKTIKEFSRLLKPGGSLILTAPSNCLRHMDPYFFTSGYSDRFYEYFLNKYGFENIKITAVGDYYKLISVEILRIIMNTNIFIALLLLPTFIYLWLKKPNKISIDTACIGYHIVCQKNKVIL